MMKSRTTGMGKATSAKRYGAWVVVGMSLILSAFASGASVAAAACPNESIREEQSYAATLPDCRAYEQVTPVDKSGISVGLGDATSQAAATGDAITFSSILSFDVPSEGAAGFPFYVGVRTAGGWSSESVLAPTETTGEIGAGALDWGEDLSAFAERVYGANLPGATPETNELYLREANGQVYKRIAHLKGEALLEDAMTPNGSDLIFEAKGELIAGSGVVTNKYNVYEWDAETERLSLVGILPASEGAEGGKPPKEGSIAGPYEWLQGEREVAGGQRHYYMQNVVSADGGRVFWTAGKSGVLYVDEEGAEARIASAHFDAANAAGSELLADDGSELVEYAIAHAASGPAITPAVIAPPGSGVMGVLGMSEDGSYVYFAANAVLAANEGADGSHASTGDCLATDGGTDTIATCNLYLWHDGHTTFIAQLGTTDHPTAATDWYDWTPQAEIGGDELTPPKLSRVTPGGTTLLFASHLDQTAYDSAGHIELYRYEAPGEGRPNGSVACVSCNPTGAPPARPAAAESAEEEVQEVALYAYESGNFLSGGPPFLTRNLSADGSRVFFDSSERLLAQDLDERGVRNVYEWEAAGSGACQASSTAYSATSGGCLYMLSTGQSPEPSFFVDASTTGEDAFIDTSQPLVAQDGDQLYDIYDARVDGGIAAQNERPPSCSGEECKPPVLSPPAFQAPASGSLSGTGNLAPPTPEAAKPAAKPKAKSPTRAQQLKSALGSCRKKKAKRKRRACEANAKRKYGKAAGSARDEGRRGR